MTLTLANLRAYIKDILSGGRMSLNLPGADADAVERNVINQAGKFFYSMHGWQFRERPPASLSFIADEEYIDLPPDFGEMIAYQTSDGLNQGIQFTTSKVVAERRSTSVVVSQNYYWAAIVQPRQLNKKEAPPPPRIELWPTPSATSADALKVWYRSSWPELDDDDDVADVPWYAEFIFVQIVRAFAEGFGEEYVAGNDVHDRLERLFESRAMRSAMESDGSLAPEYGALAGGAIQLRAPAFTWRSAASAAIADPS